MRATGASPGGSVAREDDDGSRAPQGLQPLCSGGSASPVCAADDLALAATVELPNGGAQRYGVSARHDADGDTVTEAATYPWRPVPSRVQLLAPHARAHPDDTRLRRRHEPPPLSGQRHDGGDAGHDPGVAAVPAANNHLRCGTGGGR